MEESVKPPIWRSAALIVTTLGLIAAFFYYLYLNADKYKELLSISAPQVFTLFVLSLFFPALSGILNTYLFRSMGADISFMDSFFLTAASTLANQLPISGGIISKGFYLKRRYGVPYSKFLSATMALFFCFIAVDGLIGLTVLFYWMFFEGRDVPPVLLIGFAGMASCFFVFRLPVHRIQIPGRIQKWIAGAVEGWVVIGGNPSLLLKLIGLQVTSLILAAVRIWLAFHMLSQDVNMGEVMLFSAASILTQVIGFAPGGLGVREMIVGVVASTLGFDLGVSVVAVGLDRLASTFAILLAGGVGAFFLSKQMLELPATQEDPINL